MWYDTHVHVAVSARRMGSIGEAVGRRAKNGFGMHVVGVRRNPNRMPAGSEAFVDEVHGLDALPALLPKSDYVVSVSLTNACHASPCCIRMGRLCESKVAVLHRCRPPLMPAAPVVL